MAGGAAAANSGKRRQPRPSVIKARKRAERKSIKRKQHAAEVFDMMANSENRLEDEQIEPFLGTSLYISPSKLNPDAVQLVRKMARKIEGFTKSSIDDSTENNGTAPQLSYSKPAMMQAFRKYGLYTSNCGEISDIFAKFDISKDGYLSRQELKSALQQRERNAKRNVRNIHVDLIVSDEDVDFVLKEIDVEDTEGQRIDKSELLPAFAVWDELAESHVEEMCRQSQCGAVGCVVL